MGFRYHKRVGNSKGWGLNISGSGLSSSYRGKYGSFSSKGFSIKTSIPGLSFRSGFGGRKGQGIVALFILLISGFVMIIYIPILITYNLFRFGIWVVRQIIFLGLRIYERRQISTEQNLIEKQE